MEFKKIIQIFYPFRYWLMKKSRFIILGEYNRVQKALMIWLFTWSAYITVWGGNKQDRIDRFLEIGIVLGCALIFYYIGTKDQVIKEYKNEMIKKKLMRMEVSSQN
jgi:hypothetical protein